jgi:hypothetical protein
LNHGLGYELSARTSVADDKYLVSAWNISEHKESNESASETTQELGNHVKDAEPLVELTSIFSKHESQCDDGVIVASRNPRTENK